MTPSRLSTFSPTLLVPRITARAATVSLALLAAVALLLGLLGSATVVPAGAATKAPPRAADAPAAIEDLAAYVPANSCYPAARAGTVKLGKLLVRTYPNTFFGGARTCGALPDSEHHDGRAVDWMNSIRNKTQAAQAKAVINWLMASDTQGHQYANARRLGVMYVIWNGKIWGAYNADRGWRPYAGCDKHAEKSWDTTCHRDHMHISLSWAGALGHTSYWSGTVAAQDYGRCRQPDLNWAYGYRSFNPKPCARTSRVAAPQGASTLRRTLTLYSGRHFRLGQSGAGVTAVQKAVGAPATGRYTDTTAAKVKVFQRAHGVDPTGRVTYPTWRALLKAVR